MIQNFWDPTKICLSWTWFKACTFQLKLMSAPCLILFKWRPRLALYLIALLMIGSTSVHLYLSYALDYAPTIYKSLHAHSYHIYKHTYADFIHKVKARPFVSLVSFAPGLILGLKSSEKPPGTVEVAWPSTVILTSVASLGLVGICLGFTAAVNDAFKNIALCMFSSFMPLLWLTAIALIIFVTLHRPNWVAAVLNCQIWVVISKLCHWLYLLNPLMIVLYLSLCESSFIFNRANYLFLVVTCFSGHPLLPLLSMYASTFPCPPRLMSWIESGCRCQIKNVPRRDQGQ